MRTAKSNAATSGLCVPVPALNGTHTATVGSKASASSRRWTTVIPNTIATGAATTINHMGAALPLVLDFAFDRLRLHRVEAACLPSNEPSRAVLLRTGFGQEGYARRYLQIDGKWQDHLLFAILREDWRS